MLAQSSSSVSEEASVRDSRRDARRVDRMLDSLNDSLRRPRTNGSTSANAPWLAPQDPSGEADPTEPAGGGELTENSRLRADDTM